MLNQKLVVEVIPRIWVKLSGTLVKITNLALRRNVAGTDRSDTSADGGGNSRRGNSAWAAACGCHCAALTGALIGAISGGTAVPAAAQGGDA